MTNPEPMHLPAVKRLFFRLLACCAALAAPLAGLHAQTCNIQVNTPGPYCPGQPVAFTAQTGGPGFVPLSYTWNFGDGTPLASGQQVSHAFPYNTALTTYTVTLTVLDTAGTNDTCVTQINLPIQYGPQITATGTTFDPTFCLNVLPCGTTFSTTITLNTGGLPGPFTWNWGDGTVFSGSITESHTYTGYGTYPLTITAPGSACPSLILPIQFYTRPNNPNIETPAQNYCEDDTIDVQIDQTVVQCPDNLDYYVVYWDYANDQTNRDTIYNTSVTSLSIVYDLLYGQVCSPLYSFSTLFQREIRLFAVNRCTEFLNINAFDANPVNISIAAEPEFSAPAVTCVNSPVTFTNQSCPNNVNQPLSYLWNFGDPASGANNTSTAVSPVHTYTAPGIYQVTLTASNTNCGPRTIVKQIEVRIPPDANFTPSASEGCRPLSVLYANNAHLPYNNYTWTASPNTGVAISPPNGGNAPTVTFSQTGQFIIQVNVTNTCGFDSFRDTIQVYGRPGITLSPLPDSCGPVTYLPSLASLTDNGRPVDSIRWNFGPNASLATAAGPNPGLVTFTPPPGGGLITVTVTAYNACGGTSATETFFLNPSIALSGGTSDTICLGDTICLTPSIAGGFFTFGGLNDPTGCYSPAAPGAYSVIYTVDSLNCLFRDTVGFQVNPPPAVEAGAPAALCAGDSLLLQGLPGAGVWTVSGSAGGSIAVLAGDTVYIPAAAGTATLTFTYTDPAGCAGSDTRQVTVNPLPAVSILQSSLDFCVSNTPQDLAALLAESPPGGVWSVPGGIFTPSTPGVFTVYYSFTNASGCQNRDSVLITVSEPAVTFAGPDDTVCLNTGAYILPGFSPAGGQWQPFPGLNTATGQFNPALAGAGTHPLIYQTGTGTCLRRDTVRITVQPLPGVNAGPATDLCAGASLPLAPVITNSASGSGVWSAAPAAFGAFLSGASFDPPASSASTAVTLTYTYTDSATGCSAAGTRSVNVCALPAVAPIGPLTLCLTNQAQSLPVLVNESPAGGLWQGPGIVSSSTGAFNPASAGIGAHLITYIVTGLCGCVDSVSFTVNVTAPQPALAGADGSLCRNAAPQALTGLPAGGSWESLAGATLSSNNLLTFNPLNAAAQTDLVYVIFEGSSCEQRDTVRMTVLDTAALAMGPLQRACADAPLQLLTGYSPLGGVWSSGTPGLVTAGGTVNPALLAPNATANLSYLFTNAQGCVSEGVKPFRSDSIPLVNILPTDTTYCQTSAAQPLPARIPAAGGVWSGPGVSGNQFIPGTVGSFTVFYTFQNSLGCDALDSVTVNVTAPQPALAGADGSLCRNAAPQALTGLPAGGSWESLAGATLSPNNLLTFNPLNAAAETDLVYVIFEGSSCEQRDTVRMTVLDTAALAMGPLQRACADAPLQLLTGYSPLGGVWSSVTPGLVTAGGTVTPALLAPNATANLSYLFTNAQGCVSEGVKPFRSDSIPLVNILPTDTTYCQTSAAQPLPARIPAAGGVWSGPGVSGNQFIPGTVGSFTVFYTFQNSLGCDALDSVTVNVTAPQPALAGGDTIVCSNGGSFTRAGLPAGGYWRQIGTGFFTANNLLTFNPQAVAPGIYAYQYIIFEGTSCEQRDTAVFTVQPAPVLSTQPDSVCVTGLPLTLTQGFVSGVLTQGEWFGAGVVQQGGSYLYTGPAGVLPFTSPVFYTFADTVNTIGCRDTAAGTVTVMPQPVLSINPLPNTCVNTPFAFTSASGAFPAAGYSWDFGDGSPLSTAAAPLHAYLDTGTFTVTLIAATPFGCTDTFTASIFVSEPPEPQFQASADTACAQRNILPLLPVFAGVPDGAGIAVSFTDLSNAAGGTYFWDFGGGWDASGNSSSTLAVPPVVYFAQDTNLISYVVSLTIANYCDTVTVTDTVTVRPLPQAAFGPSGASSGCSIFPVNYVNLSLGAPQSFEWYADGVLFSALPQPPTQFYSYTGTGDTTYFITLIASNACGTDTGSHEITVFPNIVDPDFNVSVQQACPGVPIRLINLSAASNSGNFDLGDGTTYANQDTVFHTYSAPGLYLIRHFVDNGCSYDTGFFSVSIFADTALILPSANPVCPGDTLSFSLLPAGGVSGPQWDFGDGTTDSGSTAPVHVYYLPGTYQVQLGGTTTQNGCPVSASAAVTVSPAPPAGISASALAGCEGLSGLTVNFSAQPLTPGAAYSWDFGDGNSAAGPAVQHAFLTQGGGITDYTVILRVNAPGQFACPGADTLRIRVYPNPQAAFTFSLSDSCGGPATADFQNQSSGSSVSYLWSFGNGSSSTLTSPSITYGSFGLYPIVLTVTDLNGCTAQARDTAVIYQQPEAILLPLPAQGCEPLQVTIGSASTGFTDLFYDLGNGQSSASASPFPQTYFSPGQPVTSYTIRLIASQSGVCFDTVEAVIAVASAPQSDFALSADSLCGAPATVAFQQQASDLGAIQSYLWGFGDPASGAQNSSAQPDPSHLYAATGSYPATLIVTNDRGCRDTAQRMVAVLPQPQAEIAADRTLGCYDRPFVLSNALPAGASGHRWLTCDGRIFTGVTASIPFTLPDTCQVILIADQSNFCFARDTVTLRIGTPPRAAFEMDVQGECADTVFVLVQNNSTAADRYRWDFGDGRFSQEFEPLISYTRPDSYLLTLIAVNSAFGCEDTARETVPYLRAIADFALSPLSGCSELLVSTANRSVGANTYSWDFGDGSPRDPREQPAHLYTRPGSFTVTLYVSYNGVCRDTLAFPQPVEVFERPRAGFQADALPTAGLWQFTDTSRAANGPLNRQWDFGDGSTSLEPNPVHQFEICAFVDVSLAVSDAFGCADTARLDSFSTQLKGLFVPTAFAPDAEVTGAGEYRYFMPKGIGLDTFRIAVYNDWGNLLWESRALDAQGMPAEYWDGTVNGRPLAGGVFIWRIHTARFCDGSEYSGVREGSVTLLR